MKRKRKRWLWLVIAFACMMIVFGIAELTGASVIGVLGRGVLGVIGFFAALLLAGISFIIPFIFRAVLGEFISNNERLSILLGVIGVCAIAVGWLPTGLEPHWSLFLTMSGFSMGCLAGAEYQKHLDLREKPRD